MSEDRYLNFDLSSHEPTLNAESITPLSSSMLFTKGNLNTGEDVENKVTIKCPFIQGDQKKCRRIISHLKHQESRKR